MEGALSDFCDVGWQSMLDAASVEALIKATSAVSAAPASVEDMIALVRLPRVLIEEAVGFAKQHANVCLLSLADLPSMPVPDPWDEKRKADLEARVRRTIGQVLRLAQKHWGFSKEQMAVSQCAASTELLGEVASRWEEGQRAYHKALQKCDTATVLPSRGAKAVKEKAAQKRPWKRGKSTDERLAELIGSPEGLEKIFAAKTVDGVAALIKRSHGAVADSPIWKKKIRPMFERLKAENAYSRLEFEERRLDRRSDQRRK
jgi:hypothetical protein